jgi:hypothetical protein
VVRDHCRPDIIFLTPLSDLITYLLLLSYTVPYGSLRKIFVRGRYSLGMPQRTQGFKPGLLRLWHWQSDTLTTRLDLVYTRLDLIHTRLDLIHTLLDLINVQLDLIHTWPNLIHTWPNLIHTLLDLTHARIDLIHILLHLIHARIDLIHTRLDLIHPCERLHHYKKGNNI